MHFSYLTKGDIIIHLLQKCNSEAEAEDFVPGRLPLRGGNSGKNQSVFAGLDEPRWNNQMRFFVGAGARDAHLKDRAASFILKVADVAFRSPLRLKIEIEVKAP